MSPKRKFKKKSSFRKLLNVFIFILLLGCIAMISKLYFRVYQPNIVLPDNKEKYIFIPSNSDLNDVVNVLSEDSLLLNTNSFEWLARIKKYDANIKSWLAKRLLNS